jgi:hypothetical protein
MNIETRDVAGWREKLGLWFNGKRFAPLGPRESGKSTFIDLLVDGKLRDPEKYVATKETRATSPKKIKVGQSELYVATSHDPSGSPLAYGEWKRIHDESDYVIYFVNVRMLDSEPSVALQIRDDMRVLAECRSNYWWWQSWPHSVVAATHCDELPGYADRGDEAAFVEKIKNRPLLRQLALLLDGEPDKRIAVGSLGTWDEGVKFLDDILKRLSS